MAAAGVTERGVVGASKIAERLVEHTAAGVGVVEALEDDVKKKGMKKFLCNQLHVDVISYFVTSNNDATQSPFTPDYHSSIPVTEPSSLALLAPAPGEVFSCVANQWVWQWPNAGVWAAVDRDGHLGTFCSADRRNPRTRGRTFPWERAREAHYLALSCLAEKSAEPCP